jgi:LysR family transcriptional activator of nhaA
MLGIPSRLNLRHLRYFLFAARHGSVTAAARALHVAPQTVSTQLRELESAVGHRLFERGARGVRLTHEGELALEYASGIFALSEELAATLAGRATPRKLALRLGVADSVPKLLTVSVLDPVLKAAPERLELSCREGPLTALLSELSANDLDAVFAEQPAPPALGSSLGSHLLIDGGVSFLASRAVAAGLPRRFPDCLDGAPFLTGFGTHSYAAQALDAWFSRRQIAPRIVGRFDDSALAKSFAQHDLGVIAVPESIEREVGRQYALIRIGHTQEVRLPLYVVRPKRRHAHPLVALLERQAKRH